MRSLYFQNTDTLTGDKEAKLEENTPSRGATV